MNWLNKLERKIGKYAIPNLIVWLIGAYSIGFVMSMAAPGLLNFLNLQPYYILHGQIWRIVTWIFQPTDTNILFLLIMMMFYYQLGMTLERTWGTFRFNVYLIGGIILTVVGSVLVYGIIYLAAGAEMAIVASSMMGGLISTTYINMSIFLAFASMYPDMQVMLYFIIPIKMKWMAIVYVVMLGYNVVSVFSSFGGMAGTIVLMSIVLSLLNFLIFFLSTRNFKRYSPHEIHRRQQFKSQMKEPRPGSGITKHKCAVCGRTEQDDPNLEFRFCSKCEGNYEYCSDHLFTHQHMRKN